MGTPIGTTCNCYGNCSQKLTLSSGIRVHSSTKYFYFNESQITMEQVNGKEAFEKFANNPENKKYFQPQVFVPDVLVAESYADYKAGVDRSHLEATRLILEKRQLDHTMKKS